MAKGILVLGILAVSLISAAPINEPPHKGPDIRIFTPDLKQRSKFNIYDDPVLVNVPPQAKTPSFVKSANVDDAVKDKANIATTYLSTKHSIPVESIQVTDAYTDQLTNITHIYVRQLVKGVEVTNGVGNININARGRVISSSHSFASQEAIDKVADTHQQLFAWLDGTASIRAAFKSLTDYVKTSVDSTSLGLITILPSFTFSSINWDLFNIANIPSSASFDGSATAKRALIQNEDGSLTPVWTITLEQQDNWWSANINMDTGKIESINNWYSSSEAYNVLPRSVNDPEEGGRQMVKDPAHPTASPRGWVTSGSTYGNNVWAQNNPSGMTMFWWWNHRPRAAAGNVFDYPMDLTKQPDQYADAAITQLFYTVNTMHDLSYLYGFDEAAGNFQDTNYSGRGRGGDGVIANAQDGSGTNNANFATPPDGQRPKMRMYVWTQNNPKRDGDLEQDIVAHEFTHGISNRLTGGPSNSDCLNDLESGGMGEGWSDAVANLLRLKPGDTRSRSLLLGQYAYGKGIRRYPYSTSTSTNPSTYKYLDDSKYQEVHAVGEVWAEILYEVTWNLIDANGGKIGDLFARDLKNGNSLALQLILDGMKLQPCNPDFIAARNAIIQADQTLTGGKSKCPLWKGFAKRGLGPNAKYDGRAHTEDSSVPAGC